MMVKLLPRNFADYPDRFDQYALDETIELFRSYSFLPSKAFRFICDENGDAARHDSCSDTKKAAP